MRLVVRVKDFPTWRAAARGVLAAGTPPELVSFEEGAQEALFGEHLPPAEAPTAVSVPKEFVDLAEFVAMHRNPARWNLLYRILYRMALGKERRLLELHVDPDVAQVLLMQKALRRDIHKMHAFVRFRKVEGENEEWVAWHRPDHLIVQHVAPWFVRRFGVMRWTILTPDATARWDLERLQFGPGAQRDDAPQSDALEDLWRAYYKSIFNPARTNGRAMKQELPVRHWATLPEANLIPLLMAEAPQREKEMRDKTPTTAEPFLPAERSLPHLQAAMGACRGCELWRTATQPVFGEGPAKARILFVGEQPGDQEDLAGKPFVGPAGQVFDEALRQAGIDRAEVYVTNAVKHFKFEERGKRRIHKKPRGSEIAACRPWLSAEVAAVDPEIIVALGATAALSIAGREFSIQKERGTITQMPNGRKLLITVHPSFLLRIPEEGRAAELTRFVNDLRSLRKD